MTMHENHPQLGAFVAVYEHTPFLGDIVEGIRKAGMGGAGCIIALFPIVLSFVFAVYFLVGLSEESPALAAGLALAALGLVGFSVVRFGLMMRRVFRGALQRAELYQRGIRFVYADRTADVAFADAQLAVAEAFDQQYHILKVSEDEGHVLNNLIDYEQLLAYISPQVKKAESPE